MDLPRFCSGHLIASYAIKAWMGVTHFLMRTLRHVRTEMALNVLAYNLTRVMNRSVEPSTARSGPSCQPSKFALPALWPLDEPLLDGKKPRF